MHPQDLLYSRASVNLADLTQRYPSQFHGAYRERCWPDGWQHLVERVCQQVERLALEDFRWLQIKEKYGGLRLYPTGGRHRVDLISDSGVASLRSRGHSDPHSPRAQPDKAIAEAEAESRRTCMRCGRAGATREVAGLILTLCDADLARYEHDLHVDDAVNYGATPPPTESDK